MVDFFIVFRGLRAQNVPRFKKAGSVGLLTPA
jgi:hypothetical protein